MYVCMTAVNETFHAGSFQPSVSPPLTSSWPHLRCDIGLDAENIKKTVSMLLQPWSLSTIMLLWHSFLIMVIVIIIIIIIVYYFMVIIQVWAGLTGWSTVDCIGLWSRLV